MERIISEEERIRRAEEISARRKNRIPVNSINTAPKKKMSLLTKTFIQVIVSMCIFGMIYFLCQNNSFAAEKIKPIISSDTDFKQIYENVNGVIKNFITNEENSKQENNEQQENQNKEESKEKDEIDKNQINGNEISQNQVNDNKEDNSNQISTTNQTDGIGGGNDGTKESQTDQDISYIKANANFIKPVVGTITSRYGERTPTDIISANHGGIDIGANTGTEVVASMCGTVELVSSTGDYGNHVKITNGQISTLYAHCSKIVVNKGDYISQGQKIAEVGSTGKATGPHLHFEIRRNNVTVDPQEVLEL